MLLHFHNPTCACNQRYNLHQKSITLPQSIFTSLFHPYLFTKSSLQSPLTSLPWYLCNFSPPSFCVQPSQQSTPKIFSLAQQFCQFRLRQGKRELGVLVRTDTVLFSPFFLKVWTVIKGLTNTDSLSLTLRKLVYFRYGKPFNPPSFIPSAYCHYFHTLLISPQELTFPWKPVT